MEYTDIFKEDWWCPVEAKSQGISSHCIGLNLPGCSDLSTRMVSTYPLQGISRHDIKLQCGAIITRSIFSKILTIDIALLASEGEIWGVSSEFTLCSMLHFNHYSVLCNIVSYWTALQWHPIVVSHRIFRSQQQKSWELNESIKLFRLNVSVHSVLDPWMHGSELVHWVFHNAFFWFPDNIIQSRKISRHSESQKVL